MRLAPNYTNGYFKETYKHRVSYHKPLVLGRLCIMPSVGTTINTLLWEGRVGRSQGQREWPPRLYDRRLLELGRVASSISGATNIYRLLHSPCPYQQTP